MSASIFSSLTNRIFFASALLVLVSIGVAVYRVNVEVTAQVESELRRELDESALLLDNVVSTQSQNLVRLGRLVADLPKLQNAVLTEDPPTIQRVADDYDGLIEPDIFLVLDRGGRALARVGRIKEAVAPTAEILASRPVPSGPEASWYSTDTNGVVQFAAISIADPGPEILGTLIIGFGVDQDTAAAMKARTNSDIAIVSGGRIVASTLAAPAAAALARFAGAQGTFEPTLGAEDYVARAVPLPPAAGAERPVFLLLRSRSERLRQILQPLQREMAVTAIAAILLATLAGYLIARTVTRPLRAITQAMKETAATGDLDRKAPPASPWDDEDARVLATTFRQMTTSLNRFQREASERQRLSALGRLSTVIAHEVRNPLMIIKTAVRSLRRAPSGDDVSMAALSIEEEVTRLNRVVTDVLDFARPIRFDLAPVDLGDLCRGAAQAATASPEDVEVTVRVPDSARTVTDAERLRSVLVNLLTNAQHAVRDTPAADRARVHAPLILLAVQPVDPDRWHILVEDRGAGIAADDLPRVFEPFFTTRRTGSGLGLALARNIVEGLGGVIAIESRMHVGTTVRIELPHRAPERKAEV